MTILDLIKKSAVTLNVVEVLQQENFDNITASNEQQILNSNFSLTRLFEFAKVMLNEIASYYLPIVKTVDCETANQQINLNVCTNLSRIVGIKQGDRFVRYKIEDNLIKLTSNGQFTIVYHQHPNITSLLDDIDMFDETVGEDILVNGLNSYYCLASGLFEEFNVYNEQYINKLSKIKSLKVFAMPRRGW